MLQKLSSARAEPPSPARPPSTSFAVRAAERMGLGVMIAQEPGGIVYCNSAAQALLGLSAGELAHSQDRPSGWQITDAAGFPVIDELCIAKVASSGEPEHGFIRRVRRADGTVAWLLCDTALAVEGPDQPLSVISSFMDVTRQLQIEYQLRESESRYRTIVDSANEGILTLDERCRITHANPRMCELSAYALDEIAGLPAAELWGTNPELIESFQRCREGTPQTFEVGQRRKNGSIVWVRVSASPLLGADGAFRGTVALVSDHTQQKELAEALRYQALHDPLTGLPNRVQLQGAMEQAIASARDQASTVALLFLDLDRFKDVNDSYGHAMGDELLKQVATRLKSALRQADTIARLGGDEFAIVLRGLTARWDTYTVARKITKLLNEPFVIDGETLEIAASVGIALYPAHGEDWSSLAREADVAMYAAKRNQERIAWFDRQDDARRASQVTLQAALREALAKNELELHYQPKIDLSNGKAHAVEALMRWRHPQLGLVRPDYFIDVAEQTGMIRQLSSWVLDEAIRQCSEWRSSGLDVSMAVNLSARDLADGGLVAMIESILTRYRMPAEALLLELTETAVMAAPRHQVHIERLRAMGPELSIDDFGTGYSSLSYLRQLPVSEIKIDASFVRNMVTNNNDKAIVWSIIELSHILGLRVVAEGIESGEALRQLMSLGCDVGQGFYLGRPMPASEFEQQARLGFRVPELPLAG